MPTKSFLMPTKSFLVKDKGPLVRKAKTLKTENLSFGTGALDDVIRTRQTACFIRFFEC